MNLLKCDNQKCDQTVDADRPYGWITAEKNTVSMGENSTRHYCSYACEHAHTYLLISGDNGK